MARSRSAGVGIQLPKLWMPVERNLKAIPLNVECWMQAEEGKEVGEVRDIQKSFDIIRCTTCDAMEGHTHASPIVHGQDGGNASLLRSATHL